MQCPRCGASSLMYKEMGFIEGMRCRCVRCGFQWMQMGRAQPTIDYRRELAELWITNKVYASHGLLIWIIASTGHFIMAMKNPLSSFLSLSSGWLIFVPTVLLAGIILGVGISISLLIGGRYWPHTKAVHIILPLLCAAMLGTLQGVVWVNPEFAFFEAGITLRNDLFVITIGAILGMLVTPIIIIRSSKVLRRKGLRPDLKKTGDERWQC